MDGWTGVWVSFGEWRGTRWGLVHLWVEWIGRIDIFFDHLFLFSISPKGKKSFLESGKGVSRFVFLVFPTGIRCLFHTEQLLELDRACTRKADGSFLLANGE